ncbi:S-layer homology domain-containing protein [Paenibacillus sp. GYB003]|uniref:S-layer homology domain-containing protein n=1 Tax=Paenibacillus sp. GYB003 TaxID=2994392 RepID=UPI002F96A04A
MSKLTMKKVSQLLAAVLLISMLMPIVAIGAPRINATFDGKNVSGSVYSDTYNSAGVSVSFFSPDGTLLGVVPAVYVSDSVYEWNFSSISDSAYEYVTLVYGGVSQAVYDSKAPEWGTGNLTASGVTQTSLKLNWPTAQDNNTVSYKVYQGSAVLGTVTGQTYYNVSNLLSSTTYSFSVYAVDSLGNASKPLNTSATTGSYGGGIGGPGGSTNPTNSDGSINVTNGQVDATTLKNAFANKAEVTLVVKGETVTIPVSALVDAAKKSGSTLIIKGDNGTYVLPLSLFNLDALAKELGVAVGDLKITVSIKKLSSDAAKPVTDAVAAIGGKVIAESVDFSITIEGKDGKKVSFNSFNDYVKRSIPLKSKPGKNATVVLYNPDTKTLSFVPSSLSDTTAEFYRTGNSVYTVVEYSKTFSDIADHWAKDEIELLAGKLIVDGVTSTTFQADRNITRAEFAALVVRSLGLTPVAGGAKFSDVKSSDWFAGTVGAAVYAGIVNGYEDGTFRPQAQITREELAAMVVRAYEFADGKVAIDQASITKALSKFSDSDNIVWGQREVAIALSTGLVNGMTDTTLETDSQATRAQAATMLKRFLSKVGFID